MPKHIPFIAALMIASPAIADDTLATGDVAAGAEQFNRQCVACHVVADANGDVLAGRNARTGPNLFALAGRALGAEDGFRYSTALINLGEAGAVWTEESFVNYVQDPTGWLRAELEDDRARGKMAYRVRSEDDALNIYAFLASLGGQEQ